jgi:cellulose synthase/poly-beta-1,6-N-acetylglucosamine synthase-like glycosyltransferase
MDSALAAVRLGDSVEGLASSQPRFSARKLLTKRQRIVLSVMGLALIGGLIISVPGTCIVLTGTLITIYAAVIAERVVLFVRSSDPHTVEIVSDEEARAYPSDALPTYTVLIPALREPEVISALLAHIDGLEYPRHLLDVKVLLEADDDLTIHAVEHAAAGPHVEVVLVPPGDPRTKPKALNFGLCLARGDLVTVYDAEDLPEPLQLRKAAIALSRLEPTVACLQAKLSYHNVEQNIITKWFTIEYAMWFSLFLPGLVATKAPLPLGGTSNHFRRQALADLAAWDPFNVTEDADLGLRMYREGYTVGVLESTTLEEANSDFVNWVKQRSRWYKGYLQTWLIHMREPLRLRRELGWRSFVQFNLFVGGTPLLAMLNPVFWAMALVWFGMHPHFIREIFPAPIFYLGMICWVFGNLLVSYLTILSIRLLDRSELLLAALLVPLYWIMMSIAAIKAFVQLVFAPNFWEKTVHGLHHQPAKESRAA